MFTWLKNIINEHQPIKPTTNLSDSQLKTPDSDPVYFKTPLRSYTKEEFESFINELKSLDDGILRINISSIPTDYSNINGHSFKIGSLTYVGISDRYYGDNQMSIDLGREPAQYYINLCKNLKYLTGKIKFEIYRSTAIISVCDYVSTSYDEWFYKVNNFSDGSTFKSKKYYDFSQDTNAPNRTIEISLSKYDENDLADKLSQIKPMKSAYIEYHYNKIKDEFEKIINQFPDDYYLITINDGHAQESMYALNPPEQDVTGSYRIDNVLFRDGYFVLIPAVMYRINIETRSKTELTKKLIASCNSDDIRIKLNKYFEIK
jgi:hypothetical protein